MGVQFSRLIKETIVMKVCTRILIETEEVSVYQRRRVGIRGYCDACGREVTLISPSEAARLINESTAGIWFFMRSNRVHHSLDFKQEPRICLASLSTI